MSVILGRYFEDYAEGEEIKTLSRTVTESDIVNFCGFSGDFNPLHTDAEYAAKGPFKGRIAHGMCGFSIATGLLVRLNIWEGTLVAFLGIENWRFTAPIKIGDTVHVVARIEKQETSKPDRGVVNFNVEVINQREEVVMKGKMLTLVQARPAK